MDWQTLLIAFAGALGGTATALVVAGTLGKGLIDQWLKKDFKRFEGKLDALASKDETKFDLIHTKRFELAPELQKLCTGLEFKFNNYLLTFRLNMKNSELGHNKITEGQDDIRSRATEIYGFLQEYGEYMPKALLEEVTSFYESIQEIVHVKIFESETVLGVFQSAVRDKSTKVNAKIREMMGSEIV